MSNSYQSWFEGMNANPDFVEIGLAIKGDKHTGGASVIVTLGEHESEVTLNPDAAFMSAEWQGDNSLNTLLQAINTLIYEQDENAEAFVEKAREEATE